MSKEQGRLESARNKSETYMKEMSKLVKVSLCVCGFVVPGAIGTCVTIVSGIPSLDSTIWRNRLRYDSLVG